MQNRILNSMPSHLSNDLFTYSMHNAAFMLTIWVLVFWLVLILPSSASCQVSKSHPDTAFVGGVKMLQQQNWLGAISNFRLSLTTHPHRAETLFYLSQAYYLSGQAEDAIVTIQQAIKLAPKNGAMKQKYGEYLCDTRECGKGLQLLLDTKREDPALNHIDFDIGVAYYRVLNVDQAIRTLKIALTHEPTNADAMFFLAECYSHKPDWPRAERMYQEALSAGRRDAATYYGLGNALLNQGNKESALRFFEKAISIDPSLSECHFQMARALRALGRTEESERHLRIFKAIQDTAAVPAAVSQVSDPVQEETWTACQRLIEQGKEAEALEILRKTTGSRAAYMLGALYYNLNRLEDAQRVLTTTVQSDDRDPEALAWLGRTELAKGDIAAAETHFEQVLQLSPKNQLGLAGLGVVKHTQEKWAESANWIERSKTREPAVLLVLCDDYLKLDRRQDAELVAELVRSFGSGDESVQTALNRMLQNQ